jgi:hypothetical protein
MSDDVINGHPAAQHRCQDGPGARTDDQVDLVQRPPNALLHRSQRSRHPRGAQDSPGAEDETDPTPSSTATRHGH